MFSWFFSDVNAANQNNLVITGIQKTFNYQSLSPLIIGEAREGTVIDTAQIIFLTQFDATDWQIQVKTETTNILLLDATEPVQLDLKEYESNPAIRITQTENIIAILNPGSSTMGEGIIKVDFPQSAIASSPNQSITNNYIRKNFNFTDTSIIIGEFTGNNIIDTVSVFFTENFNSNNWQIQVKTVGSNITLLNISEPFILNNKEYETNPSANVLTGEQIACIISAGTATQGAGIIKVGFIESAT